MKAPRDVLSALLSVFLLGVGVALTIRMATTPGTQLDVAFGGGALIGYSIGHLLDLCRS